MVTATHPKPIHAELSGFVRQCRVRRLRGMRQFAEEEIVIPDGEFGGYKFNCQRQPYAGLYLDAVDSGLYRRFAATGPTQSGKTLLAYVIPILYHLFEVGENVVAGIPDMRMAGDKWFEDLLPPTQKTRYKALLPSSGAGSRGGKVSELRMLNGATLKFMSGAGGDKSRAGFTSRVLVVTETDGMDEPSTTSRESDPITQMEGRLRARARARRRTFLECTVSIETGRIWQEYTKGTRSVIVLPCPHCGGWVSPEREHLHGWQDAETEIQAEAAACFFCPSCGADWSEQDRRVANLAGRLIHRGQEMTPDGDITGPPPETYTFGFRWSAVNNLFSPAGDIGADEFNARRAEDADNAEAEMRQYVWCLPVESASIDLTALTSERVRGRGGRWPKGIIPPDTLFLTVGLDIGKWLGHYIVIAFLPGRRRHIGYYGLVEFDTDRLGVERATLTGLRELRDVMIAEPFWHAADGPTPVPVQVWVDVNWEESSQTVHDFCAEANAGLPRGSERWRPTIGYGATQRRTKHYNHPTKTGAKVKLVGDNYYIARLKRGREVVEVNVDHWKSAVHEGLALPTDAEGSITMGRETAKERNKFAQHITAERPEQIFVQGKGNVIRWKQIRTANH